MQATTTATIDRDGGGRDVVNQITNSYGGYNGEHRDIENNPQHHGREGCCLVGAGGCIQRERDGTVRRFAHRNGRKCGIRPEPIAGVGIGGAEQVSRRER